MENCGKNAGKKSDDCDNFNDGDDLLDKFLQEKNKRFFDENYYMYNNIMVDSIVFGIFGLVNKLNGNTLNNEQCVEI